MSPRIYPTGTTLHDPELSWKGYVIHGAPDGRSHLVDLAGNEVHCWAKLGFPSELIDPAVSRVPAASWSSVCRGPSIS